MASAAFGNQGADFAAVGHWAGPPLPVLVDKVNVRNAAHVLGNEPVQVIVGHIPKTNRI